MAFLQAGNIGVEVFQPESKLVAIDPFRAPSELRAFEICHMAQMLFPLLLNSSGKRYLMLAEGTHTIIMEKNRLQLFEAVQAFLDEGSRS
jgi:hypothetical protein